MRPGLTEILGEKRKEVDALKKAGLPVERGHRGYPVRDFRGAISLPDTVRLIAEIKFASPSAGIIRRGGDALAIARMYEEAGAAAISLLTDKKFFEGNLLLLPKLKRVVSLPVLRKDFILEEIQVRESYQRGADAVLLIARILSVQQLKNLLDACRELGLGAVTEVHDTNDLGKALQCGAELIGINNRNLDTFEVDLNTTIKLASLVPAGPVIIAESGIKNGRDMRLLRENAVNAALVGTAIMRSVDVAAKARELVCAGKRKHGQSQGLRHNQL
jgi:indole-3-glycerol phosphate synthase